ncbi:unnamed protein product, partial [Chrysoparadoxa australica]
MKAAAATEAPRFLFEVAVRRWSKSRSSFKSRVLALSETGIVEVNPKTRVQCKKFMATSVLNV